MVNKSRYNKAFRKMVSESRGGYNYESDSDDGALTRLEAGEGARKTENVPDLDLMLPNDQSSRGRRKIRLKRYTVI